MCFNMVGAQTSTIFEILTENKQKGVEPYRCSYLDLLEIKITFVDIITRTEKS